MRRMLGGVLALICLAGAAPVRAQMVYWAAPPAPASRPQSDAEKEVGKNIGRTLPEAEILQPTVDPALPPYKRRPGAALSGHFKGAASDVLPGLAKAWAAAFHKLYPKVVIDIPPPYAGSIGAKELIKKTLDFVFVSRELKPDDITGFQAKFGYPPLSVPISGGTYRHFGFLDAVGFCVNKDNPIEKLSFDQLDALLSTTRHRGGKAVRTWGDLGLTGEWADKPVHVYGIKPWNGFEEFIRQRVLSVPGKRGEWRTDLAFSETVFPIAGAVAKDRYGIGYTGIAYVDQPVKMLPLAAKEGVPPVPPFYENVARADYPLSRLIYFNTDKAPGRKLDPAIEEFLRFILSRDGQQIVRAQGIYLPLRAWQAETSRGLLAP